MGKLYVLIVCVFTVSSASFVEVACARAYSKNKIAVKTVSFNPCEKALEELKTLFKTVPKTSEFQLGPNWKSVRTGFDFDGDGTQDGAFILSRVFDPAYADEEAVASGDKDFKTIHFLVIWLSNKGSPLILLPKGENFTEGSQNDNVKIVAKMTKDTLQTHSDFMQIEGSWSATTEIRKWRFENQNLRLIGQSNEEINKGTSESNLTDENLLTGEKIVTHVPGPKVKPERTATKANPSLILLTESGDCSASHWIHMKSIK